VVGSNQNEAGQSQIRKFKVFFIYCYPASSTKSPLGSLTTILDDSAEGLPSPASFTAITLNSYVQSSIRFGTLYIVLGVGVKFTRVHLSDFGCKRIIVTEISMGDQQTAFH